MDSCADLININTSLNLKQLNLSILINLAKEVGNQKHLQLGFPFL